ncbi:MAG: DegT/DnrJ/EryC1/StrS family aminotransferase [Acidobacteriia bacterium]|nr:DegT/DnrJ/EryC1/StrS family aminotransferase [Terriglobia bacterium]
MIPFVDLKAQYQSIKDELSAAALGVLESGQYALGSEVQFFEREFAAYCGTESAVAVNSGTSALHLSLLAAGVGPGDEVITVPFTFVATVAAIVYTGARPVFVDVEPHSLTMNASMLERAIGARTKAVVPVHLYGQVAEMDPILEIARARRVVVIEDAAQAHGADYKGRRAGSLGQLGCFSFYPSKNLGACGEAGMVVSSDPEYLRTLRMLRDWGQESKYRHVLRGFNYRMDNLQAAILRVKLRHLEEWTIKRGAHAALYNRLLDGSRAVPVGLRPERRHVYHVYCVRTAQRDLLRERLRQRGVQTAIHYPVPVHLMEAWCGNQYRVGDFPVAERAASEVLSLPMYPELEESAIRRTAEVIAELGMSMQTEPPGGFSSAGVSA